MRFFFPFGCRGVLWSLLLISFCLSGCGWTSKMFGSDKPAETQASGDTAEQAKARPESQADLEQIPPAQVEYTPGLDRMPLTKKPEPAQPAAKAETPAAPAPAEPTPPPPASAQPSAPPPSSAPAAVAAPEAAPPAPPVPPAKGVVPLPPHEKKIVASDDGDIDFRTAVELQAAVQQAIDAGKFLGYTEPFDAFPIIPGNDTVSAAFIPADNPERKVFFHAFYVPNQPFHKRVYGYTVIDSRTNKDFGHFDGNADGVFEQKTLEPKIILEDYVKASNNAKP